MYGSVFKMRPKPGKAQELRDYMMDIQRRPPGMATAYILIEDTGGDVWGIAVFDDEKLYRANAADPEQGKVYEGFRAPARS